MSTTTEFPESEWDRLRTEMEAGGATSAIAFIDTIDDARRLGLYSFAQNAFANRDWAGKNLDAIIAVANAGIEFALARAASADDPERRRALIDAANISSYNLSATLAECWPGDDVPRERRHFVEGLRAAENCIRWRNELNKPPDRKALGYWAQGMHALSLRDLGKAVEGFRESFECAKAGAVAAGSSAEVGPSGIFGVILGAAYLGVAEHAAGQGGGADRYRTAAAAFRTQVAESDNAETREDAEFGLAQASKVAAMFGLE